MPAPVDQASTSRLPDGHHAPTGRTLHGAGEGEPGRAQRTTSRKFYRASAKNPREQQRRQAWGKEWGAIVRRESEKIMRGTR